MDDTSEMIREQMEETKSQLSDKLESLELQVSDTVQSTGTAVNATVGAVQETVETVTDAVREAAQSIRNAFNVRRQVDRHPWLALGGSIVVGYLAVQWLAGSPKKSAPPQEPARAPPPTVNGSNHENAESAIAPAATTTELAAAFEAGNESSSRRQLKEAAVGALIGVVRDVAVLAVPPILGYLIGHQVERRSLRSDGARELPGSPRGQEFSEAARRPSVASSSNVCPPATRSQDHELGSSSGQLEANDRQGQREVGQAH